MSPDEFKLLRLEIRDLRKELGKLREVIQGKGGVIERLARIEERLGTHSLNWGKVWRMAELPLAAAVGALVAKFL